MIKGMQYVQMTKPFWENFVSVEVILAYFLGNRHKRKEVDYFTLLIFSSMPVKQKSC